MVVTANSQVDAAIAASPDEVQADQANQAALADVMFVNWPTQDAVTPFCNLLDGIDFSKHKLVFFDPLRFAIMNRLVAPEADISDVNYASFEERDFVRYLGATRRAAESLQKLLDDGGLLILRSNIPKAHIRVKKRSTAGTRKYTESVISAFFWLEEILGVYSLTYCQAKTLRYVKTKTPLLHVFGKAGVHCLQTLNSASKAQLEIIAVTSGSANSAAISKLTFEGNSGQVYMVPQFLTKGETGKMIDAFRQIAVSTQSGSLRPSWLSYYEKQVKDFSPFRTMIDKVEIEMETLKKQMATLVRKQEVYDGLPQLLFESDSELELATRTALEILGFVCVSPPSGSRATSFEVHAAEDKGTRMVVRPVFTETGPILGGHVTMFQSALEGRTSAIKAKGILVSNAARYVRPEQRQVWFDEKAVEESKRTDICLMPSLVLFTMALYVMTRHDAENLDGLKNSLRRDIIECDSIFILDRKKYAI